MAHGGIATLITERKGLPGGCGPGELGQIGIIIAAHVVLAGNLRLGRGSAKGTGQHRVIDMLTVLEQQEGCRHGAIGIGDVGAEGVFGRGRSEGQAGHAKRGGKSEADAEGMGESLHNRVPFPTLSQNVVHNTSKRALGAPPASAT